VIQDFWESDAPLDIEFNRAAEQFGGTLDLRSPQQDPRVDTAQRSEARVRTRLLFLRPMNIFHHILDRLATRPSLKGSAINKIKFGYLYTTMPNAICWKDAGQPFIGVTSGLGYLVFGWASNLLSMPGFMPDAIHGAEEEQVGDLQLLRNGFDLEKVIDWTKEEGLIYGRHRTPQSLIRMLMSYEVAHMALLHAFLHELGHCLLRHLDFLEEHLDLTLIKELRLDYDGSPEEIHLAHFLELTADNFAMEFALSLKVGEEYGARKTDGYAVWSLALDLLLWLFGHGTPLSKASLTHPHPQVRLMNKALKLLEYEKNNPGRISCPLRPDAQLPLDRLCNWVSMQLANSWKTLQLPGWISSPFIEEDARDVAYKAYRDIWQMNTGIRQDYEEYVDWTMVNKVLRID